ncbi:MAG: hypothetical protein MK172_05290 [Verrucomicrobiales bacterium]|nr:hypothetical protein [Verrucomicrobiales bacterium]
MQLCKESLGILRSFLFALAAAHCNFDFRLFFSVFAAECALAVSSLCYLLGISSWIFFEFCNALSATELCNKFYAIRTVSSFAADWALSLTASAAIADPREIVTTPTRAMADLISDLIMMDIISFDVFSQKAFLAIFVKNT